MEYQMSEYRPSFVHSSRRRSVVRRLTPAGWLAVVVVITVVVLGGTAMVRAFVDWTQNREWGTGATPPDVQAGGPRSTQTPAVTATVAATATPEGWVWWTDAMVEDEDGALVPPVEVQEEIVAAWEAYLAQEALPLEDRVKLTAEKLTDIYALSPAFAERLYDKLSVDLSKKLLTGKLLKVSSSEVNLRDGPGTEYEIIEQASAGSQLTLLEEVIAEDQQIWYRAWFTTESREVWVASWLVEIVDNYWSQPQYEKHEIVVHDCTFDGLVCLVTDTMRSGGTGWQNLATGDTGILTEGDNLPYPSSGYMATGRMIYDQDSGRWLCDAVTAQEPLKPQE